MTSQETTAGPATLIAVCRQAEAELRGCARASHAPEVQALLTRRADALHHDAETLVNALEGRADPWTPDTVPAAPLPPWRGTVAVAADLRPMASAEKLEGDVVEACRCALDAASMPTALRDRVEAQRQRLARSRRRLQVLLHLVRSGGDLASPAVGDDAVGGAVAAPAEPAPPLTPPTPQSPLRPS